MKKIIGIVLVLSGLLLATYYHYLITNSAMVSESTITTIEENFEEIKLWHEKKEQDTTSDPINPLVDINLEDGLPLSAVTGILEIPTLNVKAPLVEGEDEKLLKYAIGRILKSSRPGEPGNYVIGGHRNYVYSRYFKYLHKLVGGDLIHVKTFKGTYTYRVTKTITVAPDEVWVMDKTDTPTITMITCTIDGKRRTVVFGELLENKEESY